MKGTLYGVGVGPGDPELLTLKAVRRMRECSVIALPAADRESCVAYRIAVREVPELEQKRTVCIRTPMTKDEKLLAKSHRDGADAIEEILDCGENICYLTLGDPSVYSTYLYISRLVQEDGYETKMISGITSFCAAAASLNIGLSEQAEPLVIIPASYDMDGLLKLPGTKVLMKSGSRIGEVKSRIAEAGMKAAMVENCGMEQEHIYRTLEEIPENAGYYSLIIVS